MLEKSSGHLELREDPEHGIIVAGLRRIKVYNSSFLTVFIFHGNKINVLTANVNSGLLL